MTLPDRQPAPISTAEGLAARGLIDAAQVDAIARLSDRYAIRITPQMAALIGEAGDPVGRQFVPSLAEGVTRPEERVDPIGDSAHSPVEGIVHRYPDRALLKLLHACPVYCRFCFRRETVGPGAPTLAGAALERAFAWIEGQRGIREIILTGGDPLMLSARRLGEAVARLAAIGHVEIVRLHSRVPVVDPDRVDAALVEALSTQGAAVWLAIHANHADELSPAAERAIARLRAGGLPLVSQTVLLRGVNDDADTLEALFRRLVRLGVKPYYLHHPDLAPGTGHFRVGIEDGQRLVAALHRRLSGLARPVYVLDIPGGYGKVPIGPGHLSGSDAEGWTVTDPTGTPHAYPPQPTAHEFTPAGAREAD